ncbi:MAG: bifunctional phosphopantothenoylcysteine decarboxylase/phosphopantothenate--cysteine ligase CoaBC [Trueperaceae bacterium]
MAATGGAAAVKTPFVLRRLREAGHEVRAAATDDAYRFVTPLSLSLAAGGEVLDRESWFETHGRALHLEWAAWADLLLVAPATADALASAAHGHGHDVVSALVLAGPGCVAWAPAMNGEMWANRAVQRNVEQLLGDGHAILGPAQGGMAALSESGGPGRMLEPEELVERLPELFLARDFEERTILVSAGPTREYLDPVRFLSNPSSGRMGYAVAAAAKARGARVELVSGPTTLPAPAGVEVVPVTTAQEMYDAIRERFAGCDALVMTAAVADWRSANPSGRKEPKSGERLTLELARTPDILESLAAHKGRQVVVGFAMETEEGVARAVEKARRKKLDFICLNYPTREGSAFGGEENEITVVTPAGSTEPLPRMPKRELAHIILDRVAGLLSDPS